MFAAEPSTNPAARLIGVQKKMSACYRMLVERSRRPEAILNGNCPVDPHLVVDTRNMYASLSRTSMS